MSKMCWEEPISPLSSEQHIHSHKSAFLPTQNNITALQDISCFFTSLGPLALPQMLLMLGVTLISSHS